MAMQFILGSSGSGKTHYIFQSLINQSLAETKRPLIFIVPEQYTLQTQSELIQMHPHRGIMNIEVLSFERLAFRIYDDLAMANRVLLKDTGKSMAIRKIIDDSKDNYKLFSKNIRKKGYVKELKGLITELFQYNWSYDEFEKALEIENPLLIEKINDLRLLFEDYKKFLSDKYITSESTISILSNKLKNSSWLEEAEIYIDSFYGFTPIQFKIIQELLKKSKNVNIAITIDSKEDFNNLEEGHLFCESKRVISNLIDIALKEKIQIEEHLYLEDSKPYRYKSSKQLEHLEKNIFRYPYKVYIEKSNDIIMCQASGMRMEIQYITDSILKLVMEKGYRFRDIAVLTGDLNGYETLIKQAFEQCEIPYFMDKKKPIRANPLIELIISALDILNSNFSYASIFRYIKTGLLGLEESIIDRLENYVLAYGIKGQKAWQDSWDNPYPNIHKDHEHQQIIMEEINDIKDKIIDPLLKFKNAITSKKNSITLIVKEIYDFLRLLNIESKIEELLDAFEKQGLFIYQKEYSQIYKNVIEIFDQIVEILGEEEVTIQVFTELIKSGFDECEIGLLPPNLDQVVIGDLDRTRIKEVKALFVIGFNENKIPKSASIPNILSDLERLQIKEMNLKLAPDSKENMYKEQFSIYMALSRATDKLYLSYARTDLQGKSMVPSLLFNTINKMINNIEVYNIDEIYLKKAVINMPKPTFYQMVNRFNQFDLVGEIDKYKDAYQWFYDKEKWRETILSFEKALEYKNKEPMLSPLASLDLYGKELNNSVSRLESFSRCPFLHFIDYGLKLKERLDYSIKMPDIGILFHKAIDKYSIKLDKKGLSWIDINKELRDNLIEEAISEVIEEEHRGIYYSSARNSYLVKRLTRITKRAIWAISNQISKGEFKPIEYEYTFDGNKDLIEPLIIDFSNDRTMKLSGRIDRVDAYEDEDAVYLTVVDYKSGSKNFDMVALYYGLQLQLFVYLNSVTELKKLEPKIRGTKSVIPAGIFYFHIDDPIIKDERNNKVIEDMIMKELRLKGLVLEQKNIIRKLDSSFEKTSDVIPVSLTVNGDIGKNSSVASLEEFEELRKFVSNKVKEIASSIIEGDLSVYPYKRKAETGCDYCKYLSICRFEPGVAGNSYRQLKNLNKNEVWQAIKE